MSEIQSGTRTYREQEGERQTETETERQRKSINKHREKYRKQGRVRETAKIEKKQTHRDI